MGDARHLRRPDGRDGPQGQRREAALKPVVYLFDIDGTLLRAGGVGARSLDEVFAQKYGIEGAMRGIDAGGRTDPWLVAQVFERRLGRAATAAEIDDVLEAYLPVLERELAAAANFRVLPWVEETLDWLAGARAALGLATGNTAAGARAKLDRAGLATRFAFGGYGCDSAHRPEVVARAIARAPACDLDRIVVVGDTEHDVTAARACGVRVVAVATGSATRAALEASQPDAVLDDLSTLRAWHDDALG